MSCQLDSLRKDSPGVYLTRQQQQKQSNNRVDNSTRMSMKDRSLVLSDNVIRLNYF
jgi:hypothetical protein